MPRGGPSAVGGPARRIPRQLCGQKLRQDLSPARSATQRSGKIALAAVIAGAQPRGLNQDAGPAEGGKGGCVGHGERSGLIVVTPSLDRRCLCCARGPITVRRPARGGLTFSLRFNFR